ncbi:MAG: hypothetical protein MUP90_11440, partial [Gammaproteobacteria bacterium]|nr:hypothetical protein [Gammaproteobacteria bacterium]
SGAVMSGNEGAALVHQSIAPGGIDGDIADIKAVTDLLPDAGALTSIAQADELEEFEQHFHNVSRAWGATAAPDETNAIEANVNRPFAAISGNNTWGAAIPILGTDDNPVLAGADTTSLVQRELQSYTSQGAAAEDFSFGPIALNSTIERIRVIARESGDTANPGTLQITAEMV